MSARGVPPALISSAVVVLAAGAAQAWILDLPFRHDDFTVISSARDWLGRMFGRGSGAPLNVLSELFRPVFWALIALEREAFAEPLRAFGFYATNLGLHALLSWLVWRAARSFLEPVPAAVAALVFAVHPAGAQALAWISAGGDLLSALFLTLGFVLLRTIRSPGAAALAAAACCVLAAGSKVSGFVGVPVLAILAFLRGGPHRLRNAIVVLAAAAAVAGARAAYAGAWIPTYHSPVTRSAGEAVSHFTDVRNWLTMFAQILVPWNLSEDAASVKPLVLSACERAGLAPAAAQRLVAGLVAAIAIAPAVVFRARPAAACLGTSLVLALPGLSLWLEGAGTSRSRDFYAVMVPIAFLFGLSACAALGAWRRRPRLRPLVILGAAIVALCLADSWRHTRAYHAMVGRAIESRVASLEAIAAEGDAGTLFVVEDPEVILAQQFVLGSTLGERFSPPFRTPELKVGSYSVLPPFIESELLTSIARPLQFVATRGGRFEARGPALPPIPAVLPALRAAGAGGSQAGWAPEAPVPPRAVDELAVALAAGGDAELVATVQAGTRTYTRRAKLLPSEAARSARIALRPDRDFLLEPALDRISLRLEPDVGSPVTSVALVPHPPRIDARSPGDGATVALDGLRFVLPAAKAPCRAELLLAVYPWLLRFEFAPPPARAAGPDTLTLDPAAASSVDGPVERLDWPRIGGYLRKLSEDSGGRPVVAFWQARLFSADPERPDAETTWRLLLVVP